MSPPEKSRSPDRTAPTEADATEVDSAPKRKAMSAEQAGEVLDWLEATGSEPVTEDIADILSMSPEDRRAELLAAGYTPGEVEELQNALTGAPAEAFASREAMIAWVRGRSAGR